VLISILLTLLADVVLASYALITRSDNLFLSALVTSDAVVDDIATWLPLHFLLLLLNHPLIL
jgi:hypothetical protein